MQAYSNPKREKDPHSLPDVEVFYLTAAEAREMGEETGDDSGEDYQAGWFWWSCFPGCLPDSEPTGPFATQTEALTDAQSDEA